MVDFANIQGHNFLVYAERYSEWLKVERLGSKAWKLMTKVFLKWFASLGMPPFNSLSYDKFLRH